MKKYLLTGPKFEGEIALIYFENFISKIDFLQAQLSPDQRQWILENIAIHEDALTGMMEKMKGYTLVSEDYIVTLDEFKKVYPYARNSHLLPPVWSKMKQSDQVRAWAAAVEYAKYCERNSWYKAKIAAKWLKDKEYLNNWRAM